MDFKKFIPIFTDTITGLTFIHNKYIIHRDIKPLNIMIKAEGEYKQYLLADYGEGENFSENF